MNPNNVSLDHDTADLKIDTNLDLVNWLFHRKCDVDNGILQVPKSNNNCSYVKRVFVTKLFNSHHSVSSTLASKVNLFRVQYILRANEMFLLIFKTDFRRMDTFSLNLILKEVKPLTLNI